MVLINNIFYNFIMNYILNILLQSFMMGIITLIIGTVTFKLFINNKNKNDKNNKTNIYGMNIAFFMTGFVIHIVLDTTGFNKWYCDKECKTLVCRINKLKTNY